MGIFDRIRDALTLPPTVAPASQFAGPNHLETIKLPSEFRSDLGLPAALSREQAMSVPALARARGLLATTIARLPLVSVDADGNDAGNTPGFVTNTNGPISPFHRMLWTVDDLFFYGWSLWAAERNTAGHVANAERVPYGRWHMDTDGYVVVDDKRIAEKDIILIPGISEGILTSGASTLDQALRLHRAAARAAENPAAQVELHQTNDRPMTEEEVTRLISRWMQARRGENGGVAFTSAGIEVKEHGAPQEHLLINGRNAVAVDIARLAGMPATMLDATLSGSSLSYQNTAARMSELVTFGLAPFMAAIAARMSQNDVTPPEITMKFDLDDTFSDLTSLFDSKDDLGLLEDELKNMRSDNA